MSSGFVSGGTADAPLHRSDDWLAAQEELEANRRRKAEESRQNSGRSLYETLEANKAAKQEAFEEANKLKNQFRALDEDEVEFLDSVLESTRREEERVRRETAQGLQAFRQRQEDADRQLLQSQQGDAVSPVDEGEEEWTATGGARKRKRKTGSEKEMLKGVKLRRSSTAMSDKQPLLVKNSGIIEPVNAQKPKIYTTKESKDSDAISNSASKTQAKSIVSQSKAGEVSAAKAGLGLVDYRSDSDEG